MAEFVYLIKPSAIKEFLEKIHETGVPGKVSQDYLVSIGFKSKNDRPLIALFKSLGFLDQSGAPTDLYRKYREKKQAPKILAKAIMATYSDLYATYPDAHRKDSEALADYFRTKTGLGARAVSGLVNTFKALAENAKFEGLEEEIELEEESEVELLPKTKVRASVSIPSGEPSVTINIQLTLPVTENEAIYDKLFASLRKHLFPREEAK